MIPLNNVKCFLLSCKPKKKKKEKAYNKMMTNLMFYGVGSVCVCAGGGGGGVKILYHNIMTRP